MEARKQVENGERVYLVSKCEISKKEKNESGKSAHEKRGGKKWNCQDVGLGVG